MLMLQKFKSLRRYRQTFRNWWIAAGARYLRGRLGPLRELRLRAGGRFNFVPASDFVVVGEVFVAGAYDGVAGLRGVRRVWDVGGNIGCFVLWASGQFAGAEFHSFEPCAGTFAVLEANRALNPGIRWRVHPFGFSERDEVCVARMPKGMSGETSRFAADGEEVRLELRDIEKHWVAAGRPRIDLLKIDCEGGEYAILRRLSPEMLAAIGALVVEFHVVPGCTAEAALAPLRAAGFALQSSPPVAGQFLAIAVREGEAARA